MLQTLLTFSHNHLKAAHFLKHGYEHVIDVEEDTDVQHAFDNRNERRSIDDVSLDDEEARALAEALALAEAELEKSAAPTFNKPLIIYTDGAAKGNGRDGAIAGIGVFFGDNDPRYIISALTWYSRLFAAIFDLDLVFTLVRRYI